MPFDQIASRLNAMKIHREHERGIGKNWTGATVNNRHLCHSPYYLRTRGIPITKHSQMKSAKKAGWFTKFNQKWGELLKFVISKYMSQQMLKDILDKYLNAEKRSREPVNLGAIHDQFEETEKWDNILRHFLAAAHERRTRSFDGISSIHLKCSYAKILNDDFIANPLINMDRHSAINTGMVNLDDEFQELDGDDNSEDDDEEANEDMDEDMDEEDDHEDMDDDVEQEDANMDDNVDEDDNDPWAAVDDFYNGFDADENEAEKNDDEDAARPSLELPDEEEEEEEPKSEPEEERGFVGFVEEIDLLSDEEDN